MIRSVIVHESTIDNHNIVTYDIISSAYSPIVKRNIYQSTHKLKLKLKCFPRQTWRIRRHLSPFQHSKNWGVKMTPVGVNRGPHPQVLKLHHRV